MKKAKILILVIFLIAICTVFLIITINNNKAKNYIDIRNNISIEDKLEEVLFKYSYKNYAWDSEYYGYIIYSNGDIKEFNEYSDEELKEGKLTDEELIRLKNLAINLEDKYKKSEISMCDAGIKLYEVYNYNLNKWITIKKFGDENGENKTKESKEIQEFVKTLQKKYL